MTDWREKTTLTVEEAAKVLGVGRSAAYAAARTGDIPTIRVGRRLLVPVHALRRLLKETEWDELTALGPEPVQQLPSVDEFLSTLNDLNRSSGSDRTRI